MAVTLIAIAAKTVRRRTPSSILISRLSFAV